MSADHVIVEALFLIQCMLMMVDKMLFQHGVDMLLLQTRFEVNAWLSFSLNQG